MSAETYYSRDSEYLDFLATQLGDLTGFTTLAYELIQNADDANNATSMFFDVTPEALLVGNDGDFTDCGKPQQKRCPWKDEPSKKASCDLHSFRRVAGGEKRQRENTTGAFGIGFTAVYQITDAPELITVGRHWYVDESREPNERIREVSPCGCSMCTANPDGTLFILPWATKESALRRDLRTSIVTQEKIEQLTEEIETAAPDALIFLKRLETLELRMNGKKWRKWDRVREARTLLVSDGEREFEWFILEGEFDERASELRDNWGIDLIEPTRRARVAVAFSTAEFSEGRLFASLPTQHVTNLGFHINAEFFPSSDRKKIVFESDYKSDWNRAAIEASAALFAENLLDVRDALEPKGFYGAILSARQARLAVDRSGLERSFGTFWDAAVEPLSNQPVAYTIDGLWTNMSTTLILKEEEEFDASAAFEALELRVFHDSVRPTVLQLPRELGFAQLEADRFAQALLDAGLNGPHRISELPKAIGSNLEPIWGELDRLLTRAKGTTKATAETTLPLVSIFPSITGILLAQNKVFRADPRTQQLFSKIAADLPFLDERSLSGARSLITLCPEFDLERAIDVLERSETVIQLLYESEELDLSSMLGWIERHLDGNEGDDVIARLRSLSIFPTSDALKPLDVLSLSTNFQDPLGFADVLDLEKLGAHRDLAIRLGADALSFDSYVTHLLPKAFDGTTTLPLQQRRELFELLARKYSELLDDELARQTLASLPIVECKDGEFRRAIDVYLDTDSVKTVLGPDQILAEELPDFQLAAREFLKWIGVADAPRMADLIDRIDELTVEAPNSNAIEGIVGILVYLSDYFREPQGANELAGLAKRSWLPAKSSDVWLRPDEVYFTYRESLFSSQAKFINLPYRTEQRVQSLLEVLGVQTNPNVTMVVEHLLECSTNQVPVKRDIYEFLNKEADDSSVSKLRDEPCLFSGGRWYRSDQVFWGNHSFGRFRSTLSDDFRAYAQLLKILGVRESPSATDAIQVLLEISQEYGGKNEPFAEDDPDLVVLMECWRMLTDALESGEVDALELSDLRTRKVIPNNQNVLLQPTWMLFDDRVDLASRFNLIQNNILSRSAGAWQAMRAAGVRNVSEVVQADLAECVEPKEGLGLIALLRERQQAIARVIQDIDSASVEIITTLDTIEANYLAVTFTLKAFDREETSDPVEGDAFFDQSTSTLFFVRRKGAIPSIAVSRELAFALGVFEQAGPTAAGVNAVLSAEDDLTAHKILDQLGYAPVLLLQEEPIQGEVIEELGTEGDDSGKEGHGFPDRSDGDDEESVEPEDTEEDEDREADTRNDQEPQTVLRSYVQKLPGGKREDPAKTKRRTATEEAGVRRVVLFEENAGRSPEVMPSGNEGYDILSESGQGVRYIEVKALSGEWNRHSFASVTRAQFWMSKEKGDSHWLYVVENATVDDGFKIWPIQSPAQRVDRFMFDFGWKDAAEESSAASLD